MFEVFRVGSAGHVYYISFGEGELMGHERVCKKCFTVYAANPSTYKAYSKSQAPVEELKRLTFPDFDAVYSQRMELENKVLKFPGLLTSEERLAFIVSPFILLSPKVEKRFSSINIDPYIGVALVAAIMLLMFVPSFVQSVAPDLSDGALFGAIAVGVGLVGWQGSLSSGRYMRRYILPQLANSLRPLSPTDAEIKSVMIDLKQKGYKMGKRVDLSDLRSELNGDRVERRDSQPVL